MNVRIKVIVFMYETYLKIIGSLPDVEPLKPPEGFQQGVDNIFKLLGFIMPYKLYEPLLSFILALTSFRILWSIFITFRKR